MPDRLSALPVAATRSGAVRFGAYMLRRFGWFYYISGLGFCLRRMALKEHSAERIRNAAKAGPVVYVLLSRSSLDHLALNAALNRRRLPLSIWADGVTAFFWQPVVDAWRDLGRRVRTLMSSGRAPHPVHSGWLEHTVRAGHPTTLFIDQNAEDTTNEAFEAIIRAQAGTDASIQLVPIVVVWDRAPETASASVARQWFDGSRERPSGLGRLVRATFGRGDAFVQAGEPVDLPQLIARVPEGRRARALRTVLRRYLRRESQAVRGPRLLSKRVMKRLVLDDPPMRALAADEAQATGRPLSKVQRDMDKAFDTIAANFQWWTIRVMDIVLRPLWTRVFNGVDVPEADIDRIRSAIRDGSAVLVPSHKSHFDYLLLSWVLYNHDLIVPHVVAGINLKIPGVAFFLRRAGGFFVQRSFREDRIFPAVFSRYLAELIRQGYPVEFFIEGGRTRSGKLLTPKLGVLEMVVDAATTRRHGRAVTLLPIALAYERVAEEASYARELGGAEKAPESIGQVVKATNVLGKRYGRLYLRVGEPIDVGELADDGWKELNDHDKREQLQHTGERIIHRIGKRTVVLPSSLVALGLLAHNQRGVPQTVLFERIERFRTLLKTAGAEESASLVLASRTIRLALNRFHDEHLVTDLEGPDGTRVWVPDTERRITLEFYKNQVIHWLAPAGLMTLAIRVTGGETYSQDDLMPAFYDAVWTLRREFILDPDCTATTLASSALQTLVDAGALQLDEGRYTVLRVDRISELYALFRSIAEAYTVVLNRAHEYAGRNAKDLAKALQSRQDEWLSDGTITRPESLSLVTLQNAIRAFGDENVLVGDPRQSLSVDPDLATQRRAAIAGWCKRADRQ
ncbi:MAG: glycerol-3-phosphate O-acyltransferase [Myxococcota bacterium]|jgi:glycerol-3-phosphate O-acyltransferase